MFYLECTYGNINLPHSFLSVYILHYIYQQKCWPDVLVAAAPSARQHWLVNVAWSWTVVTPFERTATGRRNISMTADTSNTVSMMSRWFYRNRDVQYKPRAACSVRAAHLGFDCSFVRSFIHLFACLFACLFVIDTVPVWPLRKTFSSSASKAGETTLKERARMCHPSLIEQLKLGNRNWGNTDANPCVWGMSQPINWPINWPINN